MQRLFLLLLLVVTPSVFMLFLPEHFETPKYFFILFLLAFSILNTKRGISLNILDKALLLYVIWYFLTTLFSVNFLVSFWGLPNHYTGSFIFILFLTFYLILHKKFIEKLPLAYLLKVLVASSLVPLFYGYLQLFSLDFITWTKPLGGRVFSTFGQPNFFASYLGVILLSLVILILEKKHYKYLPFIVSVFILFLNTLSISAFFALFLSFFIYAWSRRKYINASFYIFLIFVLSLTFLLFGKPLINRLKVQVYASSQNVVTNDTGKIRKILFVSSLEQILNTPRVLLIGSGPETFVFFYKKAPDLQFTSEANLVFVNPHNFFLEEFFETGFVGFLFYLALVFLMLRSLTKAPSSVIPLFILAYSFFNWPGPYVYFLLFFFSYYSLLRYFKYKVIHP